jgi:hypothetical protein
MEGQLTAEVQFAHNPEINNTRSVVRPLSSREIMQQAKAVSAQYSDKSVQKCSGQIFVGLFFDGTGNNEDIDYVLVKGAPQKYKHSNVVRIYHAFKTEDEGTTAYYPFYIPGVGTPFPKISDTGGKLGTGTSWNGEPRLIWGLTRVFNAISDYLEGSQLISDSVAHNMANALGGIGSLEAQRNFALGRTWMDRLTQLIKKKSTNRPAVEQINVSVFGFSRGAAEARAFVNWLYQICAKNSGGYTFASIPIRVQFLGIFDTVASVGIAGGYSSGLMGFEGHQSWANKNMQIHPGVESCLHIVAAHEVRATFPLDSARIDEKYPPNVKEYVYPGAHSDVGGGYDRHAQAKTDALARIPGFEMYCAARTAGVPLLSLDSMPPLVKECLVPTNEALEAFKRYMQEAQIPAGPVEDMMHAHMAKYFSYRYQAVTNGDQQSTAREYFSRNFFRKSTIDREFLKDTQQYFIAIIAALVEKLEFRMNHDPVTYGLLHDELGETYVKQPFQELNFKRPLGANISGTVTMGRRSYALYDAADDRFSRKAVARLRQTLEKWYKWLADNNLPRLVDSSAPERDVLTVASTITIDAQSQEMREFFDNWVHDSMAGLAKDGVNEFLLNGIGLFKFRRIYFGNRSDEMIHRRASEANEREIAAARWKQKQRKQWDLEAAEFRRMSP